MRFQNRKMSIKDTLYELGTARILRAMAKLRHGNCIKPVCNKNCENGFIKNIDLCQWEYWYNDCQGSTHLVYLPIA